MKFGQNTLIIGLFALALPLSVWAESSSSSYILWAEAETGGGGRSTSTNYILQGATADESAEQSTSTSYRVHSGFEAVYEEPVLTLELSSTSLTLSPSTLTDAAVSSASLTATVSTNADFGYSLTLTETSEFQNANSDNIDDVADGTVTAGDEEFGVSVSGSDASFGDDQGLSTTPLELASRTIWGNDRDTTVTFEASIDAGTAEGDYTGLYTFIATSNF